MTAMSVVLLIVGIFIVMSTRTLNVANVLDGAFVLVMGGTILAWQSIHHSQERLALVADADRLRATLKALDTNREATVVVPAAVLEKVAVIEHAQIARERAHAVLSGVSAPDRGYGVVVPRDISEQKASLPPERRFEVEELIEELAAEPRSSAATGGRRRSGRQHSHVGRIGGNRLQRRRTESAHPHRRPSRASR